MIRFIDLRYQGTQNRFAFRDTVSSCFADPNGFQAWEDWDDFAEDLKACHAFGSHPLARYRDLCPPWVFEPATDEELGFREEIYAKC